MILQENYNKRDLPPGFPAFQAGRDCYDQSLSSRRRHCCRLQGNDGHEDFNFVNRLGNNALYHNRGKDGGDTSNDQ
jgi:hypothetical protein